MKQVIIFTNSNGGVSVCVPTGELPIEEVQKKDIPKGVESFIVDADTLPNEFFEAWELKSGVVSVNLEKAAMLDQLKAAQ